VNKLGGVAIFLMGLAAIGGYALAKKSIDDSQQRAQRALALLLMSSAELIPAESSCQGIYGGEVPPKLKDLLAMELASLSRGKNSVTGTCGRGDPMRCTVAISHSFGEAVSSADIKFSVKAGRLDMDSLECILTP